MGGYIWLCQTNVRLHLVHSLRQGSILLGKACLDILQINLATETIMRIQSSLIIEIVAAWLQTLKLWRIFKMALLISWNVARLCLLCFKTSGGFIAIVICDSPWNTISEGINIKKI